MKNKIFTIAEIGVNHNGKLDTALKSIDAAAKAGASAVKFQTFNANEFMSKGNNNYTYKTAKGNRTENMYQMFQRLELPIKWYKTLIARAAKNKVQFFSSAGDENAAKFLKTIGVKLMKIASPDLTNYPLLECVAKLGNKTIISTGMGDETEIDEAVKIFKKHKTPFSLLHCVSMYPTPKENTNLLRITKLKERYKGVQIGYSDHSVGIESALISIVLGATIIEKHFTLNKKLIGPDHHVSADPKEFKYLNDKIKMTLKMLGEKKIEPSIFEKKNRVLFRRSITARKDIHKSEKISFENVCLKRPETGAHPKFLKKILGKKTKKIIFEDRKIKLKDLIF